jgi:hypothetical protein
MPRAGLVCSIEPTAGGAAMSGIVRSVEGDRIRVASSASLTAGTGAVASFATADALWRLPVVVATTRRELVLEVQGEAERLQRRAHPRLALRAPAALSVLDADGRQVASTEGLTIDLSRAGLAVRCDRPLGVDAEAVLALVFVGGQGGIRVRTRLVACDEVDGAWVHRLALLDPADPAGAVLVDHAVRVAAVLGESGDDVED